MKKFLSLSLLLSLGLATITPALNAMQTMRQKIAGAMPGMPAWTKGPGFTAAKKWWKCGRNVNALTPEEQQAFNSLKKRVAIGTIIALLTAIFAGVVRHQYQAEKTRQARASTAKGIGEIAQKGLKKKEEIEFEIDLILSRIDEHAEESRFNRWNRERGGNVPTALEDKLAGQIEFRIGRLPRQGKEIKEYIKTKRFTPKRREELLERIELFLRYI